MAQISLNHMDNPVFSVKAFDDEIEYKYNRNLDNLGGMSYMVSWIRQTIQKISKGVARWARIRGYRGYMTYVYSGRISVAKIFFRNVRVRNATIIVIDDIQWIPRRRLRPISRLREHQELIDRIVKNVLREALSEQRSRKRDHHSLVV